MHKDSTTPVGQFSLPIWGASQLKGKTQAQIDDIKLKEVTNGRLAMLGTFSMLIYVLQLSIIDYYLAIGGLVHHQIIAGSDIFGSFPSASIWSLY